VSFTCVSQASGGAALAVGADVVALALGAAKSPSPAATQSSTTHERRRRNLIRRGMRPSPSDNLTGDSLVRVWGFNWERLPEVTSHPLPDGST